MRNLDRTIAHGKGVSRGQVKVLNHRGLALILLVHLGAVGLAVRGLAFILYLVRASAFLYDECRVRAWSAVQSAGVMLL